MTASPHSLRGHAPLAPSASKRWIKCPASVQRSVGRPNNSSIFAKEGTAAHEFVEHIMRAEADPQDYLGGVVMLGGNNAGVMKADKENLEPNKDDVWSIDEDMVETAELFKEVVQSRFQPDTVMMLETKLDITHVHKNLWGTGDTILHSASARTLDVLDLKYGSGVVVDVDENEQLLTYAVGSARLFNYDVDTVRVTIVQPRAYHKDGPIRFFEIDIIDLLIFEEYLRRAAEETDQEKTAVEVGDHCRFCPVAGYCPELREHALSAIKAKQTKRGLKMTAIQSLTSKQLGEIFKEAQLVEVWVRRFFEYAHERALGGDVPHGLKVVEGRAYRKWKGEDAEKAVREELELGGYDPEEFMYPERLRYPGTVEKVVGKKRFKQVFGEFYTTPVGKPVLATEDDSRPAIKVDRSDAFGAVDDI